MSLQKEWIKNREIIIESDSENAIAWANKREESPWNLRFYCNKLQNILLILRNDVFIHKNREANQIADSLAKEGAQMGGNRFIWT